MSDRESIGADQYELYGPFGYHGSDVGSRAVVVLAGLSEPIPRSLRPDGELRIWAENDGRTFDHMQQLESGIRFIAPEPGMDGGDIGDLHRAFGRFHAALPLSEAERLWLFDPLDIRKPMKPPRRPNVFGLEDAMGVAEEVTSAGLKRVVQGREVLRRLAAWRREADEFAGQGTLDEARQALGEIGTTLVTDANWPREHENLRVQLRESAQS